MSTTSRHGPVSPGPHPAGVAAAGPASVGAKTLGRSATTGADHRGASHGDDREAEVAEGAAVGVRVEGQGAGDGAAARGTADDRAGDAPQGLPDPAAHAGGDEDVEPSVVRGSDVKHASRQHKEDSEINSAQEIEARDINGHVPTKPASDDSMKDITGRGEDGRELSLAGDSNDLSGEEAATNGCVEGVAMEGVAMEGAVDSTAVKEAENGDVRNIERSMNGRLEMIQEDNDVDVLATQPGVCRMGGSLFSQDSITCEVGCVPPVLITTADPEDISDPEEVPAGPLIRVIPPAALALAPGVDPSPARKSPVTVQEWVDSLPPPRLREDTTPDQWDASRCPATAALKREASVQSDAGSHCSSVESLLGSRRADPEEILLGLGFGGASNDFDSDVARIPRRFLRPSKVKGVAIDDFLRHQHDLVQTFDSSFFGYRGLTGPSYRPPAVIVAKIMEKLRGVRPPPATSTPNANDGPAKRFTRMARKLINVLPSSVLTPDNRQFLDNQGGKSPEVPRKRMIIGQRSFTFDHDGHMIELRQPGAATDSLSASSSESDTSLMPKEHAGNMPGSTDDLNLSPIARSLSEETEANSSSLDLSCDAAASTDVFSKPALSSRSNSVDSVEASPATHHRIAPWDKPRLARNNNNNYSTSVSSWESSSPRAEMERSFSRYESIDEAAERGPEDKLTSSHNVAFEPANHATSDIRLEPAKQATSDIRLEPAKQATSVIRLEPANHATSVIRLEPAKQATSDIQLEPNHATSVTIQSAAGTESEPPPSLTKKRVVIADNVIQSSVQTGLDLAPGAANKDVVNVPTVTESESNSIVPVELALVASVASETSSRPKVQTKSESDIVASKNSFDSVPTESASKIIPTESASKIIPRANESASHVFLAESASKSVVSRRSSDPTDRPPTTLQQRRGSLKRQQHVEEDVSCVDSRHLCLSQAADVDVNSSSGTLGDVTDVNANNANANNVNMNNVNMNNVDTISMNSSQMEALLNPEQDSEERLQEVRRCDAFNARLQKLDIDEGEEGEGASRKMWRRGPGSLLRDRSDSSGFQDQDQDERDKQEQRELAHELMSRGVSPPPCAGSAVRVALGAYGDHMRRQDVTSADMDEAREDVETLRQLREMVALELRRVADLLDELEMDGGAPTVTAQITMLLRQQSHLRRRLESAPPDTSPPPARPPPPDTPPSGDIERLIQDSHGHLVELIEHNSRDLEDIRGLLQKLLASSSDKVDAT